MSHIPWSDDDLRQIEAHGISPDDAAWQLHLFEHPPAPPELGRPCTPGDGIRVLAADDKRAAMAAYEEACARGRLLKFVPASGAASRMFQTLLWLRGHPEGDRVLHRMSAADPVGAEIRAFVDGIRRFAFFEDLRAAMHADGFDIGALVEDKHLHTILDYLLTSRGLNYAAQPKGLLKFHRYADGSRTAFEEHLVEAAQYVRDRRGASRLHFTVSPQHRDGFTALLHAVGTRYERQYDARFDVGFSVQKSSTDTLAVDPENRPFRTREGHLVFRPGGHGALIENLNDLRGDVIYINNIDNVVPDRLKGETTEWKKLLAGHLLVRQHAVFRHVERLASPAASSAAVEEALRCADADLGITLPPELVGATVEHKRAFVIRAFDRPVRVCGMVRNTGEPGGGPFWVRGQCGGLTLQIVESAQVDPTSHAQQAILKTATHFNPVDIVCGVRDRHGKPFDLHRYVDREAVFIAEKSHHGQTLKALERPGLWNGGMADWTTIFVEVPGSTFNPVKTVSDLLRPEHQPE